MRTAAAETKSVVMGTADFVRLGRLGHARTRVSGLRREMARTDVGNRHMR